MDCYFCIIVRIKAGLAFCLLKVDLVSALLATVQLVKQSGEKHKMYFNTLLILPAIWLSPEHF